MDDDVFEVLGAELPPAASTARDDVIARAIAEVRDVRWTWHRVYGFKSATKTDEVLSHYREQYPEAEWRIRTVDGVVSLMVRFPKR